MFEYLSWQKDPLLLDPEPLEQNTWLTANDLCTQGKKGQIFSPIGHLNLYSFMLRKTDFVSGERLLQSFPYIVLEEEWCSLLRKQTLLLAERAHYYFHNALTNIPIRNWQKKIIEYLEKQHRLPFPLFRLADDWQDYFLEKQFVQFQSARGEDFQLPLYLTEDLAYLTGVVMGDGHLADYFINIIDSSNEHIKNLAGLLQLHFNSKIEFFEQQNAQAWNVNILGKWIVRFFNFLSGQPINERKYPSLREPLLFQSNDLFRRAFWRGLMDADGSYKSTIGFGTASKRLRKDFSLFLTQNHINHNFYEQEVFGGKTFSLNISGNSREQFATILGSNHPQKRAELETLLKRKVYRFSPRPHTLLHQDSWKGRVLKFDETKQLNGYFNLSSIPNLSLANLGSFLRTQRTAAHYSLVTLSTKFGITPSLLSKYELNKTAIPLSLFLPFLTLYGFSQESFLSNYSQLIYRSGRSLCHFPTKPTFPLLNLLQGLQLKEDGFFLLIGLADMSLSEYITSFSNFFGISLPSSQRRFYHALLATLIQEYCLLSE